MAVRMMSVDTIFSRLCLIRDLPAQLGKRA
jgi:hypothetical protein